MVHYLFEIICIVIDYNRPSAPKKLDINWIVKIMIGVFGRLGSCCFREMVSEDAIFFNTIEITVSITPSDRVQLKHDVNMIIILVIFIIYHIIYHDGYR